MKTFYKYTPTARRSGFTLVELLVAAALTVLIMTVLATAFQVGMQTLSHLKSVVGLSEQLRTAETIMRNDLGGVHLETALGDPVRVSDPRFATNAWTNPGRGYFSVVNGSVTTSANYSYEGVEENVNSYRAVDHSVFFTTKRNGETNQEVYYGDAAGLPTTLSNQNLTDYAIGNQFVSKWAEIGYVLVPIPNVVTQNDDGLTTLQLYTLNRRQRALAPNAVALDLLPTLGAPNANPNYYLARYPEISISVQPTPMLNAVPTINDVARAIVNDPVTITDINNRIMNQWNYDNATPARVTAFGSISKNTLSASALKIGATLNTLFSSPTDKVGSDIVLNNVISMQIRVMTKEGLVASQLYQDELPASLGVYPRNLDTANGSGIILRAIQIKLRVWDTKNSITRQLTITQDL